MEAGAAIPRTAKKATTAAQPSLLSGITPPLPPAAPPSAKSHANKGPHNQQPYQQYPSQHQHRPPSDMIRPSSQMSHYYSSALSKQSLPPLNDTQKKALRHLDTLTELVGGKVADQMERNKMLSVNIMDPGSREYKRQREMQQGNVDVVSIDFVIYFLICSVNFGVFAIKSDWLHLDENTVATYFAIKKNKYYLFVYVFMSIVYGKTENSGSNVSRNGGTDHFGGGTCLFGLKH
eukprot:CAMPEP_0201967058 /NCGR_PEP_ID=MMETSP0904-20121228/11847_1 /ASSEMBLY_ACC=CAM_ASM_000553 /TAXON_ID=420261 /ORGANISM="Thalassiosira antarctica, Strain CCMP982" /LENGTH=233 /DNA_ID=CAMNT_0048514431 /DNA_START=41 /DNA_END=739 /DNA_ORIENTATION=-